MIDMSERPPNLPRKVSVFFDNIQIAEANVGSMYYFPMTVLRRDSFKDARTASEVKIVTNSESVSTYKAQLSPEQMVCMDLLMGSDEQDFNEYFRESRRMNCGFYQHLMAVRIATSKQTIDLLKSERLFFQGQVAEAEAALKAARSPEAFRNLRRKLFDESGK